MKTLVCLLFIKLPILSAAPMQIVLGSHLGTAASDTDPDGQIFGADASVQMLTWKFRGVEFWPEVGARISFVKNHEESMDQRTLLRNAYLARSYNLQTFHTGLASRAQLPFLKSSYLTLLSQLGWTSARLKVDESIASRKYTQYHFTGLSGPYAAVGIAFEKSLAPTLALQIHSRMNWNFLDQSAKVGEYSGQSKVDPSSPLLTLTGPVTESTFNLPSKQVIRNMEFGISLVYMIH